MYRLTTVALAAPTTVAFLFLPWPATAAIFVVALVVAFFVNRGRV